VERIGLLDGLELLSPYPAAIMGDALLVADLHLGIEEDLELQGIHVPYDISGEIRNTVLDALREGGTRRLIVIGDLKHELGSGLRAEYDEVGKLLRGAAELGVKTSLVRGNHDNFIAPTVRRLGGEVLQDFAMIDGCCLAHGHADFRPGNRGCRCLVIGHEHPTVTVMDEVGVKHRFKAFLWGKVDGVETLVLPSPNPLAGGMPVNEVGANELLSPILRRIGVDSFEVYALEPREAIVHMATVDALRALLAPRHRVNGSNVLYRAVRQADHGARSKPMPSARATIPRWTKYTWRTASSASNSFSADTASTG
jgi:putative SbcD/Mre11-related phosphoesterase